ncbi:MAG: phosphatase PAP2 family protein [Actinomycetes bacterium]
MLPREILIVLGAVALYFGGRGITESARGPAVDHARGLVALEERTGLDWESWLQGLADGSHLAVDTMNWIYIWGHWPVIVATLLWLVLRHPDVYRRTRNAMVVSGAIGMVLFVAYPVAPPRLVPGLGLTDTVTEQSHAYRVLQPPGFTNQYAAFPSLHFGWDLLIGLAIAAAATHWLLRLVGYLLPALMALAVVATANHFVIDVLAGGLLALVGLVVAHRLEARKRPDGLVPTARADWRIRQGSQEGRSTCAHPGPSSVSGSDNRPLLPRPHRRNPGAAGAEEQASEPEPLDPGANADRGTLIEEP